MFYLNGSVIRWKSSKQETITNSTIQVKHIIISDAAKRVAWNKKFTTKLGVVPSIVNLLNLYYDNN